MAINTDVREMKRFKRNKKAKSLARKLIPALLLIAVAAAVVLTKNIWYPKLDGIMKKIPTFTVENSGELAEGNFPISITGGSGYQLLPMNGYFSLLDESHLRIYDTNGELNCDVQHEYANPVMAANSRRVLIYDLGGKKLRVVNRHKTVFEKNMDESILFARLSSNDNTAVITRPDKALSQLSVFDQNGGLIFSLTANDRRIIDVSFTENNDGIVVTTLGASGGELVSQMTRYRYGERDSVWVSDTISTMAMSTSSVEGGELMFGDNMCAFFDNNGNYKTSVEYKNTLIDFDSSKELTALIFENQERRRTVLKLINNADNSVNELNVNGIAKDITVEGTTAYILTSSGISSYNADGTEGAGVSLDDEYDGFVKLGGYIYLLGYDEINRIDFSG